MSRLRKWTQTNPDFYDEDHTMQRQVAVEGLYDLINNVPFNIETETFLVQIADAIEDGAFIGYTHEQSAYIKDQKVVEQKRKGKAVWDKKIKKANEVVEEK